MSVNAAGSEASRLVAAARSLAPTIADLRDEIERERRIPSSLIERMRNLGLFSLWLAREFGGRELSLSEFARGIGALAQADGFVGWGVSANFESAGRVMLGLEPGTAHL